MPAIYFVKPCAITKAQNMHYKRALYAKHEFACLWTSLTESLASWRSRPNAAQELFADTCIAYTVPSIVYICIDHVTNSM